MCKHMSGGWEIGGGSADFCQSCGPNLTISEWVRAIADICSGLSSHERQCVAEGLVTRHSIGPFIIERELPDASSSYRSIIPQFQSSSKAPNARPMDRYI
jgi:hypothetical protein